jgi:hypothetical protein
MTDVVRCLALGLLVSCAAAGASPAPVALPTSAPGELRPPAAFAVFGDRAERSRALFVEAGRVLLHPRCTNCHPSGDAPTQGEAGFAHDPPVARGADGFGVPGLECRSCHQDQNLDAARVPGAPSWQLAPAAMAWRGVSLPAICAQLKDRARNGGRTTAELVAHAAHDPLVAWGWRPGAGRTPAPGSQDGFGALVAAWIQTGAECPPSSEVFR